MKKKILLFMAGGLFLAGIAWASTIVYSGYLANENVAYGKTYTLDLKTAGRNRRSIDTVAATAVISSSTIPAVTFTDGGLSTGSFTVSSLTDIAGTKATDYITVVSTSGLKNSYVTINGKKLRNGYEWKTKATTALTATDIARILDYVAGVDASAASNVVHTTAAVAGTAANAYTLTSSTPAALTVNAATYAGGASPAAITIGGITLTNGVDWTAVATTSGTAQAIVTAINANASLSPVITAARSGSNVVLTSDAVGVNALALASNFAGITASGAAMTGGSASAYTINTPSITKTSHGLTTGFPVLYTEGTLALSPLTTGTTYYAIRTGVNTFQLAATSTGAVAGSYITLTSSSTVGPHTYTLTPTATAGTWGIKWQTSDDASTWTNMSVSSVTFPSPYTQSMTSWDLGTIGHRYLRLDVDEGTEGGIDLQVSVTGRNTN
jgi:hypothetical protein